MIGYAVIEFLIKIAHAYSDAWPWLPPIDPMYDSMIAQPQWCEYGTVEVYAWNV